MAFYSQKSYPTTKLGSCSNSISMSGCFLVSCCNLFSRLIDFNKDPIKLNDYCKKNSIYSNGCMLDAAKLASKFEMTYKKTTVNPKTQCIAETNYYANKGVPSHFFMIKPDGTIIDPLDKVPDWKPNPYKVVSYRVFTVKIEPETIKTPEPVKVPVIVETPNDTQNIASEGIPQLKSNDEEPVIQESFETYQPEPKTPQVVPEYTWFNELKEVIQAIIKYFK